MASFPERQKANVQTGKPYRIDAGGIDLLTRIFSLSVVLVLVTFLLNNVLIFWFDWPGTLNWFSHQQWFGAKPLNKPLDDAQATLGMVQFASYLLAIGLAAAWVFISRATPLRIDSERLNTLSTYLVRSCFWAVLLVGPVDMVISFLRVEDLLPAVVGHDMAIELGRPEYRAEHVHFPIIVAAFVIAAFVRRISFPWLGLLVVLAELQIVISRFVFSYEQAFMGDLVRFWYAALFLFASAYALVDEGHVRVDVFYARFTRKGKAWTNTLGTLLLGLPLCWVILVLGTASRGSSINSPLLSYEISQSGFGMFVKYLMAAYMMVFAVTMIVQFCSYLLNAVADLRDEPGGKEPVAGGH